jgi:hypothetical protein
MRIYKAIVEYIEARTELLREEAATLGLGTFARAYKEGREDALEGIEVVYIGEDDEDS